MRAIKKVETGDNENCENIRGASGEVGCMQYLIPTWNASSIRVLGYVADMTVVNVEYVTAVEFTELLKKKTPYQIALQHNQGSGTTCRKGVNKHKVNFNSCEYVEKAMQYYQELSK